MINSTLTTETACFSTNFSHFFFLFTVTLISPSGTTKFKVRIVFAWFYQKNNNNKQSNYLIVFLVIGECMVTESEHFLEE